MKLAEQRRADRTWKVQQWLIREATGPRDIFEREQHSNRSRRIEAFLLLAAVLGIHETSQG